MGKESCILRDVHKYKAIVFTEGGREFGYGHITRCIALYDELADMDIKTLFVINGDEGVPKFIGNRDFVIDNWYGKTSAYLETRPYSITDSYKAKKVDFEAISSRSKKALYIDDTNRLEYPKGLIVNPSIYGNQVEYNRLQGQTYLLGAEYVILRKEFTDPFMRNVNKEIKDVLITMGGSDIINVTPNIVEGLLSEKKQNITLHVVIGEGFKNQIKAEVHGESNRIKFYYNLDAKQMRELMAKCDFAIAAAGQTVNELIAMRLPFVCIMTASNQINNIKGLKEWGLLEDWIDVLADENSIDSLKVITNKLSELKYRQAIIAKMDRLHVENGAAKVVNELLKD